MDALPHGYPFRFVDRVLSREPGRVRALKLLTLGEPVFQGHLPGRPLLPGVLMVEMLAQAAAYLEEGPEPGVDYLLAQVADARFKAPAFPGDRLELEVEQEAAFGALRRVKGRVTCEGRLLCSATLVLARRPA